MNKWQWIQNLIYNMKKIWLFCTISGSKVDHSLAKPHWFHQIIMFTNNYFWCLWWWAILALWVWSNFDPEIVSKRQMLVISWMKFWIHTLSFINGVTSQRYESLYPWSKIGYFKNCMYTKKNLCFNKKKSTNLWMVIYRINDATLIF